MKQNETNLEKKGEKREAKFCCKFCDYSSNIKFSYNRHLLSSKHTSQSQNIINETNETKKEKKREKREKDIIVCECGLVYYSRTTLWRHKKICNTTNNNNDINNNNHNDINNDNHNDKDELINYLIKENQEFKNLILEIVKKDTTTNNITTHTNTNSHNKAFNLNFFLNETCKDAMNIMDFVESIQLQLSDLESVGEKGYIEGISNIIVKNLKALDVTQRPVHCTDKKRETLYVKDDDKWEKDDANVKMHKMIRKVQDKNFRMIKKFKEKYPDYHKPTSKQSDVYNNIIIESMGGRGDNDYEKEEKIIKKVSKEILVEK
jgi:hypothetical protein